MPHEVHRVHGQDGRRFAWLVHPPLAGYEIAGEAYDPPQANAVYACRRSA